VISAMTARLSHRSLAAVPHAPGRRPHEAGIVHLGLGNFHRAHQAVYTARALDAAPGPWGVVGVASRSRRVVEAMRTQDGLYTVLSLAPHSVPPLVVGVHTELLVAADQPEEVVARLADPRTRIVTLTVTEEAYAPSSPTIALLARGLERRLQAHAEPLAVVSCDNLPANGERTRALVLEAVETLGGELRDWTARSVAFPATMVDRIVPATDDGHRALVPELLGVEDAVPVPAEPFSMWVLEDRFPAGRPQWEAAGAIFSDEVGRYEDLKLRLLNGTHSLIAYLAILAGARTIAEALERREIRLAAEHVMRQEYLPTVIVPSGLDVERYMEDLLARFANPALGHRASQVASDGSLKLPARITGAVLDHHAAGRVPRLIGLTVAAYIRCLCTPDCYDATAQGTIHDPYGERLRQLGRRARDSRSLVDAVLAEGILAASLVEATPFADAVGELHDVLVRHGHRAAIDAALR
jgi:fructuronate reductase